MKNKSILSKRLDLAKIPAPLVTIAVTFALLIAFVSEPRTFLSESPWRTATYAILLYSLAALSWRTILKVRKFPKCPFCQNHINPKLHAAHVSECQREVETENV